MDEPDARLVHGRAQQQRDLEAAAHRDRAERALFWGIQGPSVRCVPVLVFADCGAVHRYIEVGRGSASPQASRKCADGRVAKNAPEVYDLVQKTCYPFFRSIRSEPIGTIISIGPHDE